MLRNRALQVDIYLLTYLLSAYLLMCGNDCRWIRAEVSLLTTRSRCAYYINILRRALWPGDGDQSSSVADTGYHGLSAKERLSLARSRARSAFIQFFPSKYSNNNYLL